VAGVRALGVDLLAVQEVDRELARSGRSDQPTVIAQARWVAHNPRPGPNPTSRPHRQAVAGEGELLLEHLQTPAAFGGHE
jgi:hypothetical protein